VISGGLWNIALVAYAAVLGTAYGQTKDEAKACQHTPFIEMLNIN
jgi:hypothetical protein